MALAVTNLTSGSNTTNNPSTTASINPTSGSLTLCWIGAAVAGGGTTTAMDTFVPSGARGTWTFVDDVDDSNNRRTMRLYAGTGTVTNEAVTITATCGAGTWTETMWVIDEWTGQDTSTPYDASTSNFVTNATTVTATDVGTPGAGDAVTFGIMRDTSEALTTNPPTGLTALGSASGGTDVRILQSFYDSTDPWTETPVFNWTTSAGGQVIGIIINAAAGGGGSKAGSVYYNLLTRSK